MKGTAYTYFTADNAKSARELLAILREAKADVPPQLEELSMYGGGGGGGGRGGRGMLLALTSVSSLISAQVGLAAVVVVVAVAAAVGTAAVVEASTARRTVGTAAGRGGNSRAWRAFSRSDDVLLYDTAPCIEFSLVPV